MGMERAKGWRKKWSREKEGWRGDMERERGEVRNGKKESKRVEGERNGNGEGRLKR